MPPAWAHQQAVCPVILSNQNQLPQSHCNSYYYKMRYIIGTAYDLTNS